MQNLGTNVSRVLDNDDTDYTSVVFQPLRPPLDSEWNLVQDIQNLALQRTNLATHVSGFFSLGPIQTRPPTGTSIWANVIKFKNPTAVVNGRVFHVGGGTNQFQSGALENIWQALSNDEDEIVVILDPGVASGSRDDLVWLEVWEQLIGTQDQINKYGFTQYAGTPLQNDLIDPNVGRETSIRTQWKYRIRISDAVDLISFREGLGHPSILAQGGKTSPVSGYTFSPTPYGHYIAGTGSAQDTTNLNTVDGFVYALPICSVHRMNSTAYSVSNPNGAGATIAVGVSDRPDGRFFDEIAPEDIEDLRHVVDLGDDLSALAQDALENIISGNPDRLVLGDTPDIFCAVDMQLDSISVAGEPNTNSVLLRRPNDVQRNFSDNEITERHALYLLSGTLDPENRLEISPPTFFGPADTPQFADYNPFIGIVNPPTIVNAVTGLPVVPASGVGINGWTNLGDRLNKGTVYFTPNLTTDVQGQQLLIEYDLVIPPGTGLTHMARNFYSVHDDFNDVPVITTEGVPVDTTLSRTINGFVDTEHVIPVSQFINPTGNNEQYRAGVIERVYNLLGNGSSSITIPATIDGFTVLNIIRVQLAASGADQALGGGSNPKIVANADGSFTVNFQTLFPQITDTIQVTLELGGKAAEFDRKNKGILNFAFTSTVQFQSTGAGSYIINTVNSVSNPIEFVYATAGYYNGLTWAQVCYTSVAQTGTPGNWTQITSLTGLGTGQLTVNFNVPPAAGLWITIPVIGSYSPTTEDEYTVTYDFIPYQGLSSLIATGEQLQATVLYLSDKAMVTTNGSGGNNPPLTDGKIGISTRLPLNLIDTDYMLDGENLTVFGQKGISSVRYIPYDFNVPIPPPGSPPPNPPIGYLKPGDLLTFSKVAAGQEEATARGIALTAPAISYEVNDLNFTRSEDLSVQCNGTNRVFVTQNPILNIFGTYAIAMTLPQTGFVVLTNGSQTVGGLTTLFTRQLVPGALIRPSGGTEWSQVKQIVSDTQLILFSPFALPSYTGPWEIYLPDMQISINGVVQDPAVLLQQVCGRDNILVFNTAPAPSDTVVINYRTGVNTLNCIYGLAVGAGNLAGELLFFTLTTTSSCEFVPAPEFNALSVGEANHLIFNNTMSVNSTTGEMNFANRVLIAADLFYPRVRRLKINQKVTS